MWTIPLARLLGNVTRTHDNQHPAESVPLSATSVRASPEPPADTAPTTYGCWWLCCCR